MSPRSHRPVHQERTSWAPWIQVILWGTLTLSALLVLTADDVEPMAVRMPIAVGLLAFGAIIQWLVGGLRVRLYRDHLEASLGHAGLIRGRFDYAEILRTEVVTYSPIGEFGGWGYRFRGDKRAWTARGDEAVVLHMKDGKRIYVGSERPGRLRERLVAVAGTRLGASSDVGEDGSGPGDAAADGAEGGEP